MGNVDRSISEVGAQKMGVSSQNSSSKMLYRSGSLIL